MNLSMEELKDILDDLQWDHKAVGIRFEEKEYAVGDIISDSKHNPDRNDNREFPAFGNTEYDELPDFPGVSTWNTSTINELEETIGWHSHCYVVIGDGSSWTDNVGDYVLDENELLIEEGRVALILK